MSMFGIKKLREEIADIHKVFVYQDKRIDAIADRVGGSLTAGEITALRALLKEKYDCTTCWDKGGANGVAAIERGGVRMAKHCPDCGRPFNHKKGAK